MPATYDAIATTTLSSPSSSISFSSISQSYTDLRLVVVWQTDNSGTSSNFLVRLNNDSNTYYSDVTVYTTGASVSTLNERNLPYFNMGYVSSTENTFWGYQLIDILDYKSSSYKNVLNTAGYDRGSTGGVAWRSVGLYRSTAVISSVQFFVAGNFVAGTTATLYGILKA